MCSGVGMFEVITLICWAPWALIVWHHQTGIKAGLYTMAGICHGVMWVCVDGWHFSSQVSVGSCPSRWCRAGNVNRSSGPRLVVCLPSSRCCQDGNVIRSSGPRSD